MVTCPETATRGNHVLQVTWSNSGDHQTARTNSKFHFGPITSPLLSSNPVAVHFYPASSYKVKPSLRTMVVTVCTIYH